MGNEKFAKKIFCHTPNLYIYFFKGGINLLVKNTAYKLINKNFKTWLKMSCQN